MHEGDGARGKQDWQDLNSRAMSALPAGEQALFCEHAMRCYASKRAVVDANADMIRGGFLAGVLPAVVLVPAQHNTKDASTLVWSEREFLVCSGV